MTLILVSTSPRRKDLLDRAGITYEAVASDYVENMISSFTPANLVQHLAEGKVRAAVRNYKEGILLGADTIISLDDKVFGKPKDTNDAKSILRSFSGRPHEVYTGIAVINARTGRIRTAYDCSKVFFKEITDQQIDEYIATGEPMDKAGAYAIQGIGKQFIDRIEGNYDTIVGLPVGKVRELVIRLGGTL